MRLAVDRFQIPHRRSTHLIRLAIIAALAVPSTARLGAQQLTAGTNVNMVGGPAQIIQGPPFQIIGDPFLQRQNEPSMACSSRSSITCLAGANDYRLVNLPGTQGSQVTGDAWLGLFWTHDDGRTWRSTVVAGFPQDNSPAGLASPISGFPAAADPTVRAGTNGLFYYSGIAYSPAASSNGGKSGVMFASLYIDDNNSQDVTAPPRYIRTVILDNGNNGQFLDKPWIATDIPRAGAGSCTIPGSNGVPDQVVPAGNVYAAYSVFTGSGNHQNSKLLFTRSTDCGKTWGNPVRLDASIDVSQSAQISVNPVNGNVLVAWRSFATPNNSASGQILVAQSTNFGVSFSSPLAVADLGLVNASTAFDLSTLPDATVPNGTLYRMFRTNGYPAMCVDTTGLARIAWAQRGIGPQGDARILLATSSDGTHWSAPVAVDNQPARGHQFMPAMACSASTATLLWYDQRDDNAQTILGQAIFGVLIADLIPPPPAHTLDVRAAQTGANGQFGPSIKVSRYDFAFSKSEQQLVQLQFNPVNWPLFSGGQLPFIGDYIDLAPGRLFQPPIGTNNWSYNTDTSAAPVIHATWTDNRDIVPPLNDMSWSAYVPPGCAPPTNTGIRNQNVYTSRLTQGVIVGAGGSSRLTGTITRAFAVDVQNATSVQRRFRLQTGLAPGGPASFDPNTAINFVDVNVPAFSGIVRTIFVAPAVTAIVKVFEIDATGNAIPNGLQSSTSVNGDATAPPPADGSVTTGEVHSFSLTSAFINTYPNPTFAAPAFLNPMFVNQSFINPDFLNPDFLNPDFLNATILNPDFLNPDFLNPDFLNPDFLNQSFQNQPLVTDVSWQVTNTGNVVSGYNFSTVLAVLPAGATFQLVINRIYPMPGVSSTPDPSSGCNSFGQQYNADTVVNITSPTMTLQNGLSDSPSNATFSLGAGDMATVTLRVINDGTFDPNTVAVVATAQAGDTGGGTSQTIIDHAPPVIMVPSTLTVQATGPAGATETYSVSAIDALDGPISPTCSPASGTPFPFGNTTVTCTATDSHGNTGTNSFVVDVVDTTPPVIAAHANVTVAATGPTGATATYTAPATSDIVDGAGTAACSPASGGVFPIGNTTITCTATDAHGNTAVPTTFAVQITDLTPPVIAVHADVTVGATGPTGATVTYTAPATSDIVDGAGTATCSPASGGVFPIGNDTVTCRATDTHGNVAVATTFTVHVTDLTPPVIAAHANVTVAATGPTGATVTYAAPATSDIVDGAGTAACSPASGGVFPIGNTTITCTATDAHGNTAVPTTFAVQVTDLTPPVIAAHADVTVAATGPTGATVTYAAPATTDLVDGAGTATCSPVSGGVFPIGNDTVTCRATDAHGNVAVPTMFTVHVTDLTPPVIAAHADVTVAATGPTGATVTYTAPATSDIVDGAGTAACSPASGGIFPIGNTTITCTATDTHGNVAVATTFTVHVTDTTPPVLSLPAGVNVQTQNALGAVVTYAATATDIVDGTDPVSCSPASGSTFPVGTTLVSCSSTDTHGNTATGSFNVTVTVVNPFYGFIGVQDLPPPSGKTFNGGSSVPLLWRFTLNGAVVVSSDADPEITVVGPSGIEAFTPETPGNSSFQMPTSGNGGTWQFNWQTTNLPKGTYQIYVGSRKTGQTYATGKAFGPFVVTIK